MYIKTIIFLLLLEIIGITYTTTVRANKLIQNICDNLHNSNSLELDEDQQWETICQELFHSKEADQHIRERRDTIDEKDNSQNKVLNKAAARVARVSGGTRIGSGIRVGSIGSGIRTSPSVIRYRNTRTGAIISRPNGWQWSRSALIFLPLASPFSHRSRSSSNRFTTPATSSLTYYYCTSITDASVEIQCSSTNGESQCCETEETLELFCCGGNIPVDMVQDLNKAVQTMTRLFQTLTVLALCMHLFMRRFYRS